MIDNDTRKMLKCIRSKIDEYRNVELPREEKRKVNESLFTKFGILTENYNEEKDQPYVINYSNVQFGNVRSSQEDSIKKTIGDVAFKKDSLQYYPKTQNIVMVAEVSGIGLKFQFQYKDASGDGCYIWANGLQMTDANLRTVEKIRDAFLNWKQSIVEDGDFLQKLDKEAKREM